MIFLQPSFVLKDLRAVWLSKIPEKLLDLLWTLYEDGFDSSKNKDFGSVDKVKKILKLDKISRMAWEWGFNTGVEGKPAISRQNFDTLVKVGFDKGKGKF